MRIPISKPLLGPTVEESVLQVLRSGNLAQGPVVTQLEDRFAALCEVEHAIAVSNGTAALEAALRAHDIGPGDEVITSPFTFVATLNAILATGATARFADISEHDYNVDARSVASLITPQTRCILPVHLYGQTADMAGLSAVAEENHLAIIEDAAQAHGAAFNGRPAGSWGTGCFSLYATKNLTSGEGGLITTNNASIARRLRLYRNHGMVERYRYEERGTNLRMTDLQAAVCVPQLADYATNIEARRQNAEQLSRLLADVDWLKIPTELPGRSHVWHQYTVLVGQNSPVTRDQLAEHLAGRGIGTGIYYPRLVHEYPVFENHAQVIRSDTPNARSVAARCLSLPVHPSVTATDIDEIAQAVHEAGR